MTEPESNLQCDEGAHWGPCTMAVAFFWLVFWAVATWVLGLLECTRIPRPPTDWAKKREIERKLYGR